MVTALGHKQQVKAFQEPEASDEAGGLQSPYLLAWVLGQRANGVFSLAEWAGLLDAKDNQGRAWHGLIALSRD